MCLQIRFATAEFADFQLKNLASIRSGNEIRMKFKSNTPLLPVLHQGENKLIPWGNRLHAKLPKTGYCKKESLDAGKWRWLSPEPVTILAAFGWSKGVWFQVRQGIQGILVRDEDGEAYCYMITQPATHYFNIMTGSERMPLLIGQVL